MNNNDRKFSPLTKWRIPPSVYKQVEEDTLTRYPQEACGVLLGEATKNAAIIEQYVPLLNVSNRPEQHFSLEPQEWVKYCYHPQLLGLYHSHPTAPPQPSRIDLDQLPLFASLLKLYLIGSCHRASVQTDQQNSSSRLAFILQGYQIINNHQGLFDLRPVELATSITENNSK
ncbi:Mov34/MPN/PAD-1 family protein [Paenibacillus bouchesdurhonensis]|uniref:Mov34/MPN/PAD-1 family protein n=1 Tax=Paenibacillus bouchesdurhonensis TaxID=1870990 RepID=UPI0019013E65|nr:M67 family metallopeptidase [Paenibacillus bouchesdurhonensis]